ncbi:Coagulation factor X [Sarcoptes scabiei]|uniref:Uncharacterized protein n=1 Tax=Sarcoptes scabiei TaxID=52283 RepID=A0A132A6H8_SARSC|nr:hypothetical protein QR98_0050550 [Sarcoptes scabiei]UXI20777.1 Coagulation factor X [Sarcoptes scabiei]
MKSFIVFVTIFGFVFASPLDLETTTPKDDTQQESMNHLVDQVVAGILLRNNKTLDPLILHKDYDITITERVGLIIEYLHVFIEKGIISGLLGLHREGSCVLKNVDDTMIVKLILTNTDPLTVDSELAVSIEKFPLIPSTPMVATIDKVSLEVQLALTSDGHVKVTSLTLVELKHVHVHHKHALRMPFLERLLTALLDGFIHVFHRFIADLVNHILKPILEEELKYIKI